MLNVQCIFAVWKFASHSETSHCLSRLKKPMLDADDPCSIRPISNLSFISKLVERVVTSRFVLHYENNKLFPASQSAYRQFHSTETAVCIVHNDLVRAVDRGHVTTQVMLDLSAPFDTVDHSMLLEVLRNRFSVSGVALEWFNSYLSNRTQTFCFADSQSDPFNLVCSVPQGSVLGQVEYVAYTEDIVDIPCQHGLNNHMYADDKQLYVEVAISEVHSALNRLSDCVSDIKD